MMPCLHNYVTVDPPGFLANSRNIEVMYEMAKKVEYQKARIFFFHSRGRHLVVMVAGHALAVMPSVTCS